MPSKEQIDAYISSVEDYVYQSYELVTNVDAMNDSVQRLWTHVTRFGPPELPDIRLPSLGRFEVPAPAPRPPPPPPTGWFDDAVSWACRNKMLTGAICAGTVGAGLLVGYGVSKKSHARSRRLHRSVGTSSNNTRRLLVVVLGGDSPLGPALISGLEKEGYIVIASVSDPDAVAKIEASGNGYVRALVFDPSEPATLQPFLRSLKATLGLRFPLNTAGDPYQSSPASFPILHSVISLLTLPDPTTRPTPMPFEHLSLTSTYEAYLSETHIMPLQVIQALLPLFRMDSVRVQDIVHNAGGKRSIVVCVPAADARVGIPYAAAQSMSAAATVRGADILRRELKQIDDAQMRGIQVIVADVGAVGSYDPLGRSVQNLEESMTNSMALWTPSEHRIYASPFSAFVNTVTHGSARKPVKTERFVRKMIQTVGHLAGCREGHPIIVGLKLWAVGFHQQLSGNRIVVGAGAYTYAIASHLPTFLLDVLLNLPAIVVSIRNKYLPIAPFVPPEVKSEIYETTDSIYETAEVKEEGQSNVDTINEAAPSVVASEPKSTASSTSERDTASSYAGPPTTDSSWISVQE